MSFAVPISKKPNASKSPSTQKDKKDFKSGGGLSNKVATATTPTATTGQTTSATTVPTATGALLVVAAVGGTKTPIEHKVTPGVSALASWIRPLANKNDSVYEWIGTSQAQWDMLLAHRPIVAMFSMPGCSPCEQKLPFFRNLANQYPQYWFVKVMSLKPNKRDRINSFLVDKLGIESYPTYVVFDQFGDTQIEDERDPDQWLRTQVSKK